MMMILLIGRRVSPYPLKVPFWYKHDWWMFSFPDVDAVMHFLEEVFVLERNDRKRTPKNKKFFPTEGRVCRTGSTDSGRASFLNKSCTHECETSTRGNQSVHSQCSPNNVVTTWSPKTKRIINRSLSFGFLLIIQNRLAYFPLFCDLFVEDDEGGGMHVSMGCPIVSYAVRTGVTGYRVRSNPYPTCPIYRRSWTSDKLSDWSVHSSSIPTFNLQSHSLISQTLLWLNIPLKQRFKPLTRWNLTFHILLY